MSPRRQRAYQQPSKAYCHRVIAAQISRQCKKATGANHGVKRGLTETGNESATERSDHRAIHGSFQAQIDTKHSRLCHAAHDSRDGAGASNGTEVLVMFGLECDGRAGSA